jgi:hypothetical protein
VILWVVGTGLGAFLAPALIGAPKTRVEWLTNFLQHVDNHFKITEAQHWSYVNVYFNNFMYTAAPDLATRLQEFEREKVQLIKSFRMGGPGPLVVPGGLVLTVLGSVAVLSLSRGLTRFTADPGDVLFLVMLAVTAGLGMIGFAAGRAAGFDSGEQLGVDAGRATGHSQGYDEGLRLGKAEGEVKGYDEGQREGYRKGFTKGYDEGFKGGRSAADDLRATATGDSPS